MELTGTVLLDRYHIERKIGEGGMGHVFRAIDMVSQDPVAIKILKEDLSLRDTYLRRFQREVRSGSLLNHSNIVRLMDEGDFEGRPFLVMEYVEGRNLRKWAKNKRRAIPLILEKFEVICEAIDCAHRLGIIHRDMKPENVLVTYTDEVKLMDFGLARKIQESTVVTAPGTFIGTVVYTSPEQASGKVLDHRSDIYAIGVMLYEMLTGKLPFKGEDPIGVLFQHIHNKPESPRKLNKNISEELENLVLEVLSKKPDERPQTALELAKKLQAIRAPMLESPTITHPGIPPIDSTGSTTTDNLFLSMKNSSPLLKSKILKRGSIQVTCMLLEMTKFTAATEAIDYPTVQRFLDEFNKRLEDETLKRHGKVIQPGGHRAFYIFRDYDIDNPALAAVESARDFQRSIDKLKKSGISKTFFHIPLNIGIETTTIPAELSLDENISKIVAHGKYYHTASLILKRAKALNGSSILVDGNTFKQVEDKVPGTLFKKMFVRGRIEPVYMYSIDWQE